MEPLQTKLTNFLSYRDVSFKYDGIDLAVVSGPNGTGKTSFFTDAPTWCFYGEGSKGGRREMDNYVTAGEKECRVENIFRLDGKVYKVIRHRSLAKDKTILELYMEEGSGWTSLTGKTITETQNKIEELLRMDYKTFTSSALILQGQSDSFTKNMTDTERKETLARILGLDIWDILLEKVKKEKNLYSEKKSVLQGEMAPLAEKVEKKTEYVGLLNEANLAVKACEEKIAGLGKNLSELEAKVATKQLLIDSTASSNRKVTALKSELETLTAETELLNRKIERLTIIMTNRDKISDALKEEENIKSRISFLNVEIGKKDIIEKQAAAIKIDLDKEKKEIEDIAVAIDDINKELIKVQDILARKDLIEKACADESVLAEKLKGFENKAAESLKLSNVIEESSKKVNTWDNERNMEILSAESAIAAKVPSTEILKVMVTEMSGEDVSEEIAKYRNVFLKRDDILKACEEVKGLNESLSWFEEKASMFTDINKEIETQYQLLNKWISDNKGEIARLEAEINARKPMVETLKVVPCSNDLKASCNLLQNARKASEEIDSLQVQLEETRCNVNPHKAVYDNLCAKRDRLDYSADKHKELKKLVDDMNKTASLRPELDVVEKLLETAKVATKEIEELQKAVDLAKSKVNPHKDDFDALCAKRNSLGYVVSEHNECKALIEETKKTSSLRSELSIAETKSENLKAQLVQISDRLNTLKESTLANRNNELLLELGKIEDYATELERRQARLDEVEKITKLKSTLDQAEGIMPELQSTLEKNNKRIADINTELDALNKTIEANDIEIGNIALYEIDIPVIKKNIADCKDEESKHRNTIGSYEKAIKDAEEAEIKLSELTKQFKEYAENIAVSELLEKACGKKSGVPAYIIENAVPDIERLTNELLEKVTGGQFQVRLDTQAEGKTTGAMQDVLRVIILDSGNERPYHTYSGAEKFIIDISLRIAISKFLAHRAGAEIKILVIDEGFGSLDANGRYRILEALNVIKNDFSKVIIITHLEELKDAFNKRIEVSKDIDGSKIKVA